MGRTKINDRNVYRLHGWRANTWVMTNSRWGGTRAREQIPISNMLTIRQFKTMMRGSDISRQLADFLREILPCEIVMMIYSKLFTTRGGILCVSFENMLTLDLFGIRVYHEYDLCKEIQVPVGFEDGLMRYQEKAEVMATVYGADFGCQRGLGWRNYDEPIPFDFVVVCKFHPCNVEVHGDEEYSMIGSRKQAIVGANFAVNANVWKGQARVYVEVNEEYVFLDSSDCYFCSNDFEYRGADVAALTVFALQGDFCDHTQFSDPLVWPDQEYNNGGYHLDYDQNRGVTLVQGECADCIVEAVEEEDVMWEGPDDDNDDGGDFGP